MAAVVAVESGGDALALHDNTLGRSFRARDRAQAATWAGILIGMGHSVDLGLSQIDSSSLGWVGLSVADAFDPCRNLRAGSTILGWDYASASARFGPGQTALRAALGAYNTGSLYEGAAYVDRILAAAGLPPERRPAFAPAARRQRAPHPTPKTYASGLASVRRGYSVMQTPGSPVVVIDGHPVTRGAR